MASGMNFRVLLQLQAKEFEKGVKGVKKSLTSLKNTVKSLAGALGAGLGLGKLVSEIKNTAVKLSVAQATLKNVTDSTSEYADSIKYLNRISNAYGQDVLSLTKSYAQFRAAAKTSNLTLEQQRDIYEALTKASGAYHLSAEQTQYAMMALTQMISKGKVQMQELRLQLGNNLPGAFNIMTAAAYNAGIIMNNSTAEMEEAMQRGKVTADKVLPAFAEMLNQITEAADFNSLQSSLNRFSNSWTVLVGKIQAADIYQKLVDEGTTAFTWLGNNLTDIKNSVLAVFNSIIAFGIFKKLAEEWKNATDKGVVYFNTMLTNAVKLKKKMLELSTKIGADGRHGMVLGAGQKGQMMNWWDLDAKDQLELINKYNKAWLEHYDIMKKVSKKFIFKEYAKGVGADYDKILKQTKEIDKYLEEMNSQMSSGVQAAGSIGWTLKTKVWSTLQAISATIKSMGIIALISAIIGGISKIISNQKELKKEAERISNIYKEYEDSMKQVDTNVAKQGRQIYNNLELVKDTSKSEQVRKKALDEINKALGRVGDTQFTLKDNYDEITKSVDKWVQSLQTAARASKYADSYAEAMARKEELRTEKSNIIARQQKAGNGWFGGKDSRGNLIDHRDGWDKIFNSQLNKDFIRVGQIDKEIVETDRKANDANSHMQELAEDIYKLDSAGTTSGSGGSGGSGGKSGIDKVKDALDDYSEKVNELNNQLKNGAISQVEYSDELGKIAESTWKAVAASDNLETVLGTLGPKYKELAKEAKDGFQFAEAMAYVESAIKEADKDAEKSLNDLMEKENKYYEKFREFLGKDMPEKKTRDTSKDYKAKKSDILSDQAKISSDYVSDLEAFRDELLAIKSEFGSLDPYLEKMLDKVVAKLREAGKEAQDLKDKANIAEWIEDVEALNENLKNTKFDMVKDVSSTFDKIASGAHSMAEAFATLSDDELDEDTQNFFNKLDAGLSIMNETLQVWEMFQSIVEGVKKTEEAYGELKDALSAKEKIQTAAKLGMISEEAAAEAASVSTTVGAEMAKTAASETATTAKASEAVAGAASSVASVPYVGPILAAAAIATIVGLLSANLGKFAKGGIVGGSMTSGDKNLIRANSGEMILNKSQQGALYNALASGSLSGGGGEWRVRGTDLIKVINNTQNKMRG